MKITTLAALAVILVLAAIPSTAQFLPQEQVYQQRPQHQQQPELIDNLFGLRLCPQEFALCEASICTPTGHTILVNGPNGVRTEFPEAECGCPIVHGPGIADVNGGNMQGDCVNPGPNQVWSLYSPKDRLPQQINNWSKRPPDQVVLQQVCPASLGAGQAFANCFSFACTIDEHPRNGARTATCKCPLGESPDGTPVTSPNTAFITPAGQCSGAVCLQYPVGSAAPELDDHSSACLGPPFPPSN